MVTSKASAHSHPCRNLCRLCVDLVDGRHTALFHANHSYTALARHRSLWVVVGHSDRRLVDIVREVVEGNRP